MIVSPAWPYRGGIASFSHRLAKEFIDRGDDVSTITFTLQYPSILFPGKSQYSDSPKPEGVNISREISSINPISWIRVGRKIKKMKPDIVILRYWIPFMAPCLGTVARIVKRDSSIKVIPLIDNLTPHESRIGDKQLTNYFVKPCDAFMTMSRSVLNEVERLSKGRECKLVFHPPYDLYGPAVSREKALKQLDLDPEYRYMLFFGFIRDYKGLDILLKSLADSRLSGKKIKLIVAGEYYTDRKPYLQLIDDLGIADMLVLRTDFIPDDQIPLYFSVADIVVQPYKHATQSGVTQICYHYNNPMLVTNVGGLAEIVPDGKVGYATEPTVISVADALVDFFENSRYADFVKGVIEEKKRFSWRLMTDVFHSLVDSLK